MLDQPLVSGIMLQVADLGGWLSILAIIGLLIVMGALLAFAVHDWRSYRRRGPSRGYRYRRSAHERFAAGVEHQRRRARGAPPDDDDDDLLRQLLGQ